MPSRPSVRVLLAVALVTACTLAAQVVLTRLFSAVLAYHFSFLAISLALLGTGVGALLVYLKPTWFAGPLETLLARWAAVYAVLLMLLPFVLVHLNFSEADDLTAKFIFNFAVGCIVAAFPSLAAGIVIALAINGYTQWIGRVYAFDLVGAGIGAAAVVPLLAVDPPTLLVGLGLLAALASLLFAAGRGRVIRAVIAGSVVLLVLGAVTSVLYLPPRLTTRSDAHLVADRWNPLSRVIGVVLPRSPDFNAVFYDRIYAPVAIARNGQTPDWRKLRLGPQSIGYKLTGPGRALVIGGGGGRDIYNALSSGQRRVDVIELNDGIRRVVDEDMANVSGSPYSRPHVHTVIGDGRSVLARRDTMYDTIHIGFTDTLSANAAQGFALSENNLYTLQAFQEYLDHLAPGGVLNVTRLRRLVGDEAIRVTVLTLAALEADGVTHPERNVVVLLGKDIFGEAFGTVLARHEPYTTAELRRIRDLADVRGDGVAFAPGGPYVDEWAELHKAKSWDTFCHDYVLNVCPPTDNKPFFFNMKRLDQLGRTPGYFYKSDPYTILILTFIVLLLLSIVGFVLPLRLTKAAQAPSLGSLVYFAAIGLGFLLLEISLIQRFVLFLGFPTYALSVVLFALLVFTGVGSQLTTRLTNPRRGLTIGLSAAVGLIVVSSFALEPVLRALIDLPFTARVVVSVVLLAPVGILLGMPMPIGLLRFQALHPGSVPYAWGVNGVASVLASVFGIVLAINFGFTVAAIVAAACYGIALLHARRGRWAKGASASELANDDELSRASR